MAIPLRDGVATLTATTPTGNATVQVHVSAMDAEASWEFRRHVLPVLSRAGCNMGACHGALAGKGGFKLSLRGYYPEGDYHGSPARRGGDESNCPIQAAVCCSPSRPPRWHTKAVCGSTPNLASTTCSRNGLHPVPRPPRRTTPYWSGFRWSRSQVRLNDRRSPTLAGHRFLFGRSPRGRYGLGQVFKLRPDRGSGRRARCGFGGWPWTGGGRRLVFQPVSARPRRVAVSF